MGGNKFGGCIFSGSLSEWAWQTQSRCGARQKNNKNQTQSKNCDFEGSTFSSFLKKDYTNHGFVAWWGSDRLYTYARAFFLNEYTLLGFMNDIKV